MLNFGCKQNLLLISFSLGEIAKKKLTSFSNILTISILTLNLLKKSQGKRQCFRCFLKN